jgi:hypothetical protein
LIDFAEPGLFEWLAWYQDGMPDWMSGEELVAAGYNIQLAYKPYISAEELQESTESCQQFYIRNFFVTQCALQVRLWHTNTAPCRAESTLRIKFITCDVKKCVTRTKVISIYFGSLEACFLPTLMTYHTLINFI